MKILVTGAGGMAGRYISKRLAETGHEVTGIVRKTPGEPGIKTITCDISESVEVDMSPDVIIHTAGALPYMNASVSQYKSDNIDAMENLLNYAVERGVKRFINLSTIGVYGEFRDEVINEESDRINPDMYGQTKYVAERMLADCKTVQGISLRMPGIIGPGARGIWITNTINRLRKGDEVCIYSPDFVTTNFVDVRCLFSFISILVNEENWKYDTVVLACTEGDSVGSIVEHAKKKLSSGSRIIVKESERPPFRLDAEKARSMGYDGQSPSSLIYRYIEEWM